MTLESARVLHKHLLEIGRETDAINLEERFKELKKERPEKGQATLEELPAIEKEVEEDGTKSEG